KRRLVCEWPGFGESGLFADVMLSLPRAHESMNIVIPIEGNRFYFNRKINNMPVEGAARYGNETFALHPNCCLASLDWGRGVWAYQSHWVWASSSGMLGDGRRIGLNLGYGFGDNSKATENAVIIDGVVHKLGEVKFEFDSNDYNAPWTMRSDDGRLDLTLTPFKERVAKTDLKVLRSEVHQMFGRYDGTFRADDGEEIEIRQLVGFAEEHFAKW
ncbi:MAG: DUF2804 domain-containing protein, partial [Anaerolineaceae bacterium]|nr:DUF2804 domain-containing protein [Anaerolineaceae bacterium]